MTTPVETERLIVRVPFRAQIMPRGGKKLRETVHLAETAVAVAVVPPEALETAVIAREMVEGEFRETRYAGFGGDLWLPFESAGRPLAADQVLGSLAVGAAVLADGCENPFWATGTRPFKVADRMAAAPIEEAVLRRVSSSDRDEVLARVGRLAEDLLLCTDGTVWRRSVGPFLAVRPGEPVAVAALRHDLPSNSAATDRSGVWFGAMRFDEASEHASLEHGIDHPGLVGELEILRPEHVPDHDGLVAARAIVDKEAAGWMRLVSLLAPEELVAAGRWAIDAAARIHGLTGEVFGHRHLDHRPPAGAAVPSPEELAYAVDTVRSFFADTLSATGSVGRREMNVNWREHFETRRGASIRRWDLFEADRMPAATAAPELPFLEGPRP